MSNTEFALRRQTEAARDLILALRTAGEGDDEELVADTIDGETDLPEAIGRALDEIDEWTVLQDGLETKIERDTSRLHIIRKRVDRVRAAIERAMVSIDLPTLQLATATLSIAKRKPQVVIDNEAEIPARFFTPQPAPAPKLDKKALAVALADGALPGAHLDNGSVSLTIRRK